MSSCRRMLAGLGACILGFALVLSLFVVPATAQKNQNQNQKKLDKVQEADAQALAAVLDQAMAGRTTPADVALTIESYHFFKSAGTATYVPFTMLVEASKLNGSNVSVMYRVVNKNAKPVARKEQKAVELASDKAAEDVTELREQMEAERAKAEAEKNKLPPLPEASFEDLFFTDAKAGKDSQARILRAFQAEPGNYTVYIALKEKGTDNKKKQQQPAKVTVLKQEFTVPDFGGELGVSSMLLLTKPVAPLGSALSPDQQAERPYAIGGLEVVPSMGTKFAKSGDLSVYYQIYNAQPVAGTAKPNVVIEYNFYQKAEGSEKFFNKTEPYALNGSTLNPAFDLKQHSLVDAQTIPLSSFPVGDYRLNIKITDKVNGKSITKDLNFTVSQ